MDGSPFPTKNMKKLILLILLTNISYPQSLEQKISQMLMVGFSGKALTDTILINDLQIRGVGGVILFGGNVESPTQLNQLTNSLIAASQVPLFISIDQEGGRVVRLKAINGYSDTYTAEQIGFFNNEIDTRSWASLMAGWLDDANINVNLAPVADVNVNPISPAIGNLDRSFSKIPDSVFIHCKWFIDEFHQKNIFNCLKHFPGHGSAVTDSHLGFTDVTTTWSDSELIPYRKLIESGYDDFIMSGHLYNANIDPVYPASLSNNTLTKLLRDSLGFNGLIITDGMFMGAITNNYTFDEAVALAINAGNDILLYTTNKFGDKSLVDSVTNIVLNKIATGIITEERIDESYNRIMLKKQGLTNVQQYVDNILPDEYEIINYPNPFNNSTTINVRIPEAGLLSIKVYNMIGEEISEIANAYYQAGNYSFIFSSNELSSGVYLLRMKIGEKYLSHKIVLMK